MSKPLNSANILPFPPLEAVTKYASKNNKDWGHQKAHNAFHNAKGRCQNPNNKDFGNYGKAGIKFLLHSLDELIFAIGLPPTKKHSLDRIDPYGHYEAGNLRWALKAAQQNNKKQTHGGACASIVELAAMYEIQTEAPLLRANAWEAWDLSLRGIARGYFTTAEVSWFIESELNPNAFEAGWEMGQHRDLAEPVSFFHLPSLTWPGRAVRLRGGPFGTAGKKIDRSGTLSLLASPQYVLGLPQELVAWTKQDMNDGLKCGAIWEGQVSEGQLRCGGLEGVMLKIASRLRHSLQSPVSASFYPALKLAQHLDEIGPAYKWQTERSPVLDDRFLFIPDFQIDVGEGFTLPNSTAARFATLLEYRRSRGFKTFVGVQNAHKLPKFLAKEVLGHLKLREMSKVLWEGDHTAALLAQTGSQSFKMGRFGFGHVRAQLKHGS